MSTIISSCNEANKNWYFNIDGTRFAGYQSFESISANITSAKFYLKKVNSPTGNAYAKIYLESGVFGTSSVPTGDALATSDPINVAGLATDYTLVEFNFTGANQILLENGTRYCVVFEYTSGSGSNLIEAGVALDSNPHPGNAGLYAFGNWYPYANMDLIFYVYGNLIPPTINGISTIQGINTITL